MNTLELLDEVAPYNTKKSRVETIRDMYLDHRFTVIQKRAIELVMGACAPHNSNTILSCSFHETFIFAEMKVSRTGTAHSYLG